MVTLERQDGVPTLERGNDQGRAVERFFGPGEPAACRMHFAGMARSYYTTGRAAGEGCERAMPVIRVGTIMRSEVGKRMGGGYCVVAGSAAGATGVMRILSMRVLSISTTSKRKPCSSKYSASWGMRPSTWMTKPPRVW